MLQPKPASEWASSITGREINHRSGLLVLLIALFVSATSAVGQWPCLDCVGGQPPDVLTISTNRLDLNADGQAEFEIVENETTRYFAVFGGGWSPQTSSQISMVPLGNNRILTVPPTGGLSGDVPVLNRGDTIGETQPGTSWETGSRTLLHRVEPMGLAGPLASVWMGLPGKSYIGISLGTPEAPIYGWLCFTRDRGVSMPLNWGYARAASEPVTAGDPDTAPALKLAMGRIVFGALPFLTWEPAMGGVIVEEGSLRDGIVWTQVDDPSDPGFRLSSLIVDATAPDGEARLFRVRLAP